MGKGGVFVFFLGGGDGGVRNSANNLPPGEDDNKQNLHKKSFGGNKTLI